MRVCLQRVTHAKVLVRDGSGKEGDWLVVDEIKHGFVALIGVSDKDTEQDVDVVAEKVSTLRVFADSAGKMNASLLDIGGSILAISQFTLYADCRKGRRPSFTAAGNPELAENLYLQLIAKCRSKGINVGVGRFGAHMQVQLVNDGPVTILLETRDGSIV
jgi:D-tyrosyl-tRNA(Tyr) deacylase